MGILDRIRGAGKPNNLNIDVAIMVILTSCMQHDGDVGDDEIRKLRSILAWSPIFSSNSTDEDDRIIGLADEVVATHGLDRAIDLAIQSLPNHLRTTALCFAFDLVFSDGAVDDSEKEFLAEVARRSKVPPEILDAIDLVTHAKYASG